MGKEKQCHQLVYCENFVYTVVLSVCTLSLWLCYIVVVFEAWHGAWDKNEKCAINNISSLKGHSVKNYIFKKM